MDKILEHWDIYNSNEEKTGKIILRGEKLQQDEYHLVVHIWIKSNKKYLIQRRAQHLDWMPNIWTTTGGCANSDEAPLETAIRETKEEIGLSFVEGQFNFIRKSINNNTITYVYIIISNINDKDIKLDPNEVSDYILTTKGTLLSMKDKKEFYDYGDEYFEDLFKY